MSDETTLLPCPFCGGEAEISHIRDICKDPQDWYWGKCPSCHISGKHYPTEDEATAAWNTRATHGTLTAEQVREAIFNGSSYASYDGAKYYADGIGMQAIADELNAALGSGTCEMVLMWSDYEDGECYKCSKCGDFAFTCGGEPRFCPECGAKVVGK